MLLIQILLVLFFFFAIIRVVSRFRDRELSRGGLVFWLVFWLLAGVVAVWPDTTFIVARFVGITRGADLVVYSSLALLFFMVFKIMVRIERINKNITKLTRKQALDESDSIKGD